MQLGETGAPAKCPFLPGFAGVPPYLAGRERQQIELREQLDQLSGGAAPHPPPILFGPRGNGKTALLNWMRQQALDRGINALELLTSHVRTTEEFVNRFSPNSWWRSMIEFISIRGAEVRLRKDSATLLIEALAKLVKKQPAILFVEEAHTLEPTLEEHLFQATLALISAGEPFQIVLAGTPNLPSHMRTTGVTFWERSLVLPITRLDQRASSDAIRIPLESGGRPIARDALERVVQESNGYPYFLQIWGKLLWDVVGETARPLRMEDVNRVHPQFLEKRNRFYLGRYQELVDRGLLTPAVILAEAFNGTDSLVDFKVNDALKYGLEAKNAASKPADVTDARNRLHDLGYIWSPGGTTKQVYFSGIPSLMSFVARQLLASYLAEGLGRGHVRRDGGP